MSRRKSPRPQRGDRPTPRHRGPSGAGPKIWLYGVHTVIAALANPARRCERVLVCDRQLADAAATAAARAARQAAVETVTRDTLEEILPDGAVHQGIAALVEPLPPVTLDEVCARAAGETPARLIVLDQVTDPHNVGAIVRTAAAFGVGAVIVPERHSPPVTGVLAKAASGGLEHCPLVAVKNLVRALKTLQQAGVWCIGLDGAAPQSLAAAKVRGPMVLVLGGEGRGLRRLTRETCDALARIPHGDAVASLNVSNAAAIALYELAREDAHAGSHAASSR